jgi:uncharacterized protein YecE (DUF72 family)
MIRFGVAGWDYKDWYGPVYPITKPKGFDPLAYLAKYFDTIEVNSTFYRPPAPKSARRWAERVQHNERFRFTAKLYRRFTHERDEAWTPEEVDEVNNGFAPLVESGRLGCVLVQFPWSFKRDLLRAFAPLPLVVEVRHSSWNTVPFYEGLAERGVGCVNIDQPLFNKSIEPGARVTGHVGYVRLHGRNYEDWFREGAESHERYDYLYTRDELEGWVERIHQVAKQARETYVITNNHFRGQAPTNAAMLRRLIEADGDVPLPPELLEAYPEALASVGLG